MGYSVHIARHVASFAHYVDACPITTLFVLGYYNESPAYQDDRATAHKLLRWKVRRQRMPKLVTFDMFYPPEGVAYIYTSNASIAVDWMNYLDPDESVDWISYL